MWLTTTIVGTRFGVVLLTSACLAGVPQPITHILLGLADLVD